MVLVKKQKIYVLKCSICKIEDLKTRFCLCYLNCFNKCKICKTVFIGSQNCETDAIIRSYTTPTFMINLHVISEYPKARGKGGKRDNNLQRASRFKL